MLCPECAYDNPISNHYCGQCGARLTQVCARCVAPNPLEYRYCGQCGTPLDGTPARSLPARGQSTVSRAQEAAGAAGIERASAPAAERPASSTQFELPVQLEGERRLATIIMADVQGSTNLFEQIGTEAWVRMMNRIFQLLESAIYRYGGEVDQFRGDGLVAFFGISELNFELAIPAAQNVPPVSEFPEMQVAEQYAADVAARGETLFEIENPELNLLQRLEQVEANSESDP